MWKNLLRLFERLMAMLLTGGIAVECAITLIDTSSRLSVGVSVIIGLCGFIAFAMLAIIVMECIKGE